MSRPFGGSGRPTGTSCENRQDDQASCRFDHAEGLGEEAGLGQDDLPGPVRPTQYAWGVTTTDGAGAGV